MRLNPRLRATLSTVIAGIAIACGSDGTDAEHSAALPVVPPFEDLTDVRLPTTLLEVEKLRSQVRPTDYGFVEIVGGINIKYFADREPGSEDHPPPHSLVEHIEADWQRVGDDSTATLWRSSLARLTTAIGVAPECFRTAHAVAIARWRSPSNAVAYLRRQHPVVGPFQQSASFSIGFSVDTTTLRHALTGAAPTPCEHS